MLRHGTKGKGLHTFSALADTPDCSPERERTPVLDPRLTALAVAFVFNGVLIKLRSGPRLAESGPLCLPAPWWDWARAGRDQPWLSQQGVWFVIQMWRLTSELDWPWGLPRCLPSLDLKEGADSQRGHAGCSETHCGSCSPARERAPQSGGTWFLLFDFHWGQSGMRVGDFPPRGRTVALRHSQAGLGFREWGALSLIPSRKQRPTAEGSLQGATAGPW